jgi:hypothetical protein
VINTCEVQRLPLLEVPEDVSFSVIANCIEAAESEPAVVARRQLDQHRRIRQLVRDGVDRNSLMGFLYRETGFSLGLYRVDATPIAEFGGGAPAPAVTAATRLALCRSLPKDVSERYSAFEVPGTSVGSVLVIDKSLVEMADEDRAIIEQVTTFVAIQDEHERAERANRSLALSDIINCVWTAEITENQLRYRLSVLGFDPKSDYSVVATALPSDELTEAVRACDATWVAASLGHWSIALIPGDRPEKLERLRVALLDLAYEGPLGLASTTNSTAGYRNGLVAAVNECLLSDASSKAGGAAAITYRSLLNMVPPEILSGFAKAVLGPVETWDGNHHTALMATLACLMKNEGRLLPTATELNIHPNTLRARLDRITRLSGRDLDRLRDKTDLLLSLDALGAGRLGSSSP